MQTNKKLKLNRSEQNAKSRLGKGRDYLVTDPEGTVYMVKVLKHFCEKHWPDNWRNMQNYVITVAKTGGTFHGGWSAKIIKDQYDD